jgi:poly(3-hydroxybutyrate) depolymerase
VAARKIALVIALTTATACDSNSAADDPGDTLVGKRAFRFQANPSQPEIDVFYYVPRSRSASSEVVIVLHGNDRDASAARDDWVAKAEQYGCMVFAPAFTDDDFPASSGYILGNVFENGNNPAGSSPKPEAEWSFSTIEPLFDEIQVQLGETFDSYELFGHSGGGQFVHRFVMFEPDARFDRAIAANPGWYSVPDETVFFPYGLEGSPVEGTPRDYFARELIVMSGDRDTDPNSAGLRHTSEADAQGLNRFDRAIYFMDESTRLATEAGAEFAWSREVVPGVGHDGALMSQRAADRLFR